ncbi:MAG: aspartyl protease family protein [Proteobacteria bacterium]|nr:aspartyl protease family protein [Pseudomonadota bacterium]
MRIASLLLATALLGTSACARPGPLQSLADVPTYVGPDAVSVDLVRTMPGGNRIYVQAELPDGEKGLFLLDTGAAISALSEETAERLGLPIERGYSYIEGLGGRAPLDRAVIPTMNIGDASISDVEVAVGVRGLPEYAGALPLDGILGNNVWGRFALEIDYPKDRLTLHRPGTAKVPRKSDPMFFDGGHVFAPLEITTGAEPAHTDQIIIQIDTGAGGLLLSGRTGQPFEQDYTEGVEPVLGLGAPDKLPASEFLKSTRRIPVKSMRLGGSRLDLELEARWLNYEENSRATGPTGMRGLVGHELMSRHVVWFDYQGGRFALTKSKGKGRLVDGHELFLAQDIERFGEVDPSRSLHRARLLAALDKLDESVAELERLRAWADADEEAYAEATVMLAAVHRFRGDLAAAWSVLEPLSAGDLVDNGELEASVNGLLLDDRADEAMELALEAVDDRAEEWAPYRAVSDVHYALGEYEAANLQLLESARLAGNPDAHLVRRARVALARGDSFGAMAHLRRLLDLYPQSGMYLWFYSQLPEDDPSRQTFKADLDQAIARLHPGDRPLDFVVASHAAMGDEGTAVEVMERGIARDCAQMVTSPTQDNCTAWYYALAGVEKEQSLALIEGALAETGDRPDFLDTKAMVHLSRGELELAHGAALSAARLSPDDIYMLWQADRIKDMATEAAE